MQKSLANTSANMARKLEFLGPKLRPIPASPYLCYSWFVTVHIYHITDMSFATRQPSDFSNGWWQAADFAFQREVGGFAACRHADDYRFAGMEHRIPLIRSSSFRSFR